MSERVSKAAFYLKIILILCIVLTGLYIISGQPAFIEKYYAEGIFPYVSGLLRAVFNFVPFSVGDIGYLLLISWSIWGIIKLIRYSLGRRWAAVGNLVLRAVVIIQVAILLFYGLWGLNYSRQPAAYLLNFRDTTYTLGEVKALSAKIIDSLNRSRSRLNPGDLTVNNADISLNAEAAVLQLHQLSSHFQGWHPHIKVSLFSSLLNYMGTSGYNNPFTGEAHLNDQMPVIDRPVTACHEMAHQLGFAREDEANFVSFLAGYYSANRLQQYSAYYLATEELLFYLRRRDTVGHKQLKALLSPQVKADFRTDSLYWTHYEGKLDLLTGVFYNEFLKANKQPAGLRTYNRMIILLLAWYREQKDITK